ncbi:MAG TPA: YIP1 family protein [Candidatus Bathyarchaeia archaeon]|nr:YIP1 family protein [Candidatus Bathyarchaeia archaeon]
MRKLERDADTMTGLFATTQDFNLKKMGSRMLRAARLDGETFRQLRDDPSATAQSLLVVAIIGLCYGAGFGFFLAGTSLLDVLTITLIGLFSALVIALVWSGATFLIVTRLFRRTIGYWGLSRPFFFSWSPGLLFVLMSGPITILFEVIRAVGVAWIGISSVFAVKHAVGFSTQQSMLTFIICVILVILIVSILPFS